MVARFSSVSGLGSGQSLGWWLRACHVATCLLGSSPHRLHDSTSSGLIVLPTKSFIDAMPTYTDHWCNEPERISEGRKGRRNTRLFSNRLRGDRGGLGMARNGWLSSSRTEGYHESRPPHTHTQTRITLDEGRTRYGSTRLRVYYTNVRNICALGSKLWREPEDAGVKGEKGGAGRIPCLVSALWVGTYTSDSNCRGPGAFVQLHPTPSNSIRCLVVSSIGVCMLD